MLKTPFGNVIVRFDGKPVNITVQKSQNSREQLYPDIEYAYLISFEFISDNSEHRLTCTLDRDDVPGDIESGEHLDAIAFYIDNGKLTLGCQSDFGVDEYDIFDYNGDYLENGLEIYIFPSTKSQIFTFGVSWLLNVTHDNEVQTWFAADPSIHHK